MDGGIHRLHVAINLTTMVELRTNFHARGRDLAGSPPEEFYETNELLEVGRLLFLFNDILDIRPRLLGACID